MKVVVKDIWNGRHLDLPRPMEFGRILYNPSASRPDGKVGGLQLVYLEEEEEEEAE